MIKSRQFLKIQKAFYGLARVAIHLKLLDIHRDVEGQVTERTAQLKLQKEQVETIMTECTAALAQSNKTIVKDLRSFTHLDVDHKKLISISEILMSTINLAKTKCLEVTDITTDFKADPQLFCYPAQLIRSL